MIYHRNPFLFLLITFLVNAGRYFVHGAWTLTIGPYEEACFVIRSVGVPRLLAGNYELLDTQLSAEPLLVYVMEEEKVVWHSKPHTAFDTFHATLAMGKKYWLCLQNSSYGPLSQEEHEPDHIDEHPRRVGFSYRVTIDPSQLAKKDNQWSSEKTEEWMTIARDVAQDLKSYGDHFTYQKRREAHHRAVVERTFSETLWWTIAEATAVIVGSVGQGTCIALWPPR